MSRRRGRLPDPVAEALLTHADDDTTVWLRGHQLSPAMRRRVAGHPDPAIREAYADFVRAMVDVGVSIGIDGLEEAYGRPRTALVEDRDPRLRAVVAQAWQDRPVAAQLRLLADPDPRVRAAATFHRRPGVPPEWRGRCLADPATRVNAAGRVPLTWDQFAQLMRSEEEDVRSAVASNPHLTADMVARLLDVADPQVRVAVARSRHVDGETRDRLYALVEADRAAGSIAADVALNWSSAEPGWLRDAPLDERLTYLDCPHAVFRRVLASCPDLPEEAWRRLDDDPDPTVRRTAAHRPDTPPHVLERLVRAHGDPDHTRQPLVEHPNFPRHTLRTFIDEPDPHIRYVALRDPGLPESALHRLATAPEPFLRGGAARHPAVTEPLLERLLADPDPKVTDEAAANPALHPNRMHRVLTDAGL